MCTASGFVCSCILYCVYFTVPMTVSSKEIRSLSPRKTSCKVVLPAVTVNCTLPIITLRSPFPTVQFWKPSPLFFTNIFPEALCNWISELSIIIHGFNKLSSRTKNTKMMQYVTNTCHLAQYFFFCKDKKKQKRTSELPFSFMPDIINRTCTN